MTCEECSYDQNLPTDKNCRACLKPLNRSSRRNTSKIISQSFSSSLLKFMSNQGKNPNVLLIGGSLALLLLLNFSFYKVYRQIVVNKNELAISSRASVITQSVASDLRDSIQNYFLQSQEMAATPFLTDPKLWSAWTIERKLEYFQNNFLANQPGIDSFVVMDAKTGDTIFSGGTGTKTRNNKYLDYYKLVVKTKKPLIISFRESTKTGIPYMYMAAPSFNSQGDMQYITRIRIKFDDIEQIVDDSISKYNETSPLDQFDTNPNFYLVDNIGRVISSNYNADNNFKQHINSLFPSAASLRDNYQPSFVRDLYKGDNSLVYLAYFPFKEIEQYDRNFDWSLFLAFKVKNERNNLFSIVILVVFAEIIFIALILNLKKIGSMIHYNDNK